MYTIKVDTELFDLLADEYGGMIEVLCRASEKLSSAADILSEIYGFGIEETADLVSIEAVFAEEIGENILMLCRKTEQVSEIYRMTDDKVTKDIEALPVLIHGNISSIGRYSDIGIENNNQESLKRLYAFSRNSFGQSYTLTSDSDIRSLCSIINESRDFICIDIAFPSEAADGNEKFLKISGNGFECGCDIRMPVISAPKKEYITEETAITEDVLKSEYELSELQDSAQSNTKAIVMICIACAAFCTIFIVIFINKKSPKKNSNISSDTYIDQENIATQIRRSYSGILTETGECSIRLTDINAPERSFRCAVGQGVIIGRNAKQCMIVIDYDGYVSRRHCRIFRDNEKFYIENLSKNQPVIINEKDIIDKISSLSNHIPDSGTKILIPYQGSATTYAKEIFSGDIIQVGHTSLRFEIL